MKVETLPVHYLWTIVVLTAFLGRVTLAAEPYFTDSFDNGQANNANGFTWGTGVAHKITTDNAFSGSHSIRFSFGPDAPGKDSWSEQRFVAKPEGEGMQQMWLEYMLFIPANFKMRYDGGPINNKFVYLWAEDETADDGQQETLIEVQKPGGFTIPEDSLEGNVRLAVVVDHDDDGNPILGSAVRQHVTITQPLIRIQDRGNWMRVRYHVRASSGMSTGDGAVDLWADDRHVVSYQNANMYNEGVANYYRKGYLMGWANTGYEEETVFYIDDVKVYDSDPGWKTASPMPPRVH